MILKELWYFCIKIAEARGPRDKKCSKCKCYRCSSDFLNEDRELKVARYSFSGSIPPKFEHKLRRQKQSFGKIATTVVLNEDENLL